MVFCVYSIIMGSYSGPTCFKRNKTMFQLSVPPWIWHVCVCLRLFADHCNSVWPWCWICSFGRWAETRTVEHYHWNGNDVKLKNMCASYMWLKNSNSNGVGNPVLCILLNSSWAHNTKTTFPNPHHLPKLLATSLLLCARTVPHRAELYL